MSNLGKAWTDSEISRKIMDLRFSVSSHRLSGRGLESLFMSPEQIRAENRRYDAAMEEIRQLEELRRRKHQPD